jgi:hypothetical protein
VNKDEIWRWSATIWIAVIVGLSGCLGPADGDGDGHPDEDDRFPEDPEEWLDSDNDGAGDNADAFPNDSQETADSDGDGRGDNSDDFPEDPQEWYDTDGDGHGDNSDDFPEDWEEWADTDGDGFGDNSDDFPDDPEYHLICPECGGIGTVPEIEELNHTSKAQLIDRAEGGGAEWHVYITVTNQDTQGGIFKVEASVVVSGQELWSGEDERLVEAGESYRFDMQAGGLSQSVSQSSLQYRVRPPSWVIGPDVTCPVCGGTGKI